MVDGYDFGSKYQADLKSQGLKVLFIDDNGHADYYPADLVLSQNILRQMNLCIRTAEPRRDCCWERRRRVFLPRAAGRFRSLFLRRPEATIGAMAAPA